MALAPILGAGPGVHLPGGRPPSPWPTTSYPLPNPAGLVSESEIGAEWPLDKVSIFAGSTFPAAVAVGDFNEATARLIE